MYADDDKLAGGWGTRTLQDSTKRYDIDLEAVANTRLYHTTLFRDTTLSLSRQNLAALERLGTEPDLARALAESIKKSDPDSIKLERVRARLERARALRA